MLKTFLHITLMFVGICTYGQTILNMELISNVQFTEDGNDIWGFVDSVGTEYAVIGTRTATRVYSLEDPSNPIERYVVSGASSTWRDIKYYKDHLYVTTDRGEDGLLIIDCSDAPNSFTHTNWKPFLEAPNGSDFLNTAHNLYIDTETGICYIAGHNIGNKGIMIVDLKQDPKEPVLVSFIDQFYSHDAYVKDGKLFSSEITVGELAIYDVTNPESPIELTRQETSRSFCHNAWATDDNQFVFTTDERNNAWMDSYDVSKDGEAIFLDRFRPLETIDLPVIPHNTHVLGNYAITSWYTDGVIVTDISKPDNIVKVGQFDSFTGEGGLDPNGGGSWFAGAWGAYPYLPSGNILVSDINTGLYVFGIDYVEAARLEGTIRSNAPCENNRLIAGVRVEILGPQVAFDLSSSKGEFKTGLAYDGSYKVAVSHPDYMPDTFDVEMVKGEITTLDITLNSQLSCVITKVVDEDNEPISNAIVAFMNPTNGDIEEIRTNQDGLVRRVAQVGEMFQIGIAKWGYFHALGEVIETSAMDQEYEFVLKKGYQDDFFVDLGWKRISTATRGNWNRADPIGTIYENELSNPDFDIDNDISNICWATGNVQGDAGRADVDEGITTLRSPAMNAVDAESMKISYYAWFFNEGGAGTVLDDTMFVQLTNGTDIITLDKFSETLPSNWSDEIIHDVTTDDIAFTDDMRMLVVVGDYNEGHIVEGAFDGFKAELMFASKTDDILEDAISISPNPTADQLTISMDHVTLGQIQIIDILGNVLATHRLSSDTKTISVASLTAGNYFIKVIEGQRAKVVPFIKF